MIANVFCSSRYFSHLVFWLPVLYVFIVGLFFSEEAKGTRLLHRDQTDEWKGEDSSDSILLRDHAT